MAIASPFMPATATAPLTGRASPNYARRYDADRGPAGPVPWSIEFRDSSSWSQLLADVHFPMSVEVPSEATFSAVFRSRLFDGIRISVVRATAHTSVRTADHIINGGAGRVEIVYLLEGVLKVRQGADETLALPHQFTVYDGACPFAQVAEEGYRAVLLNLPLSAMLVPHELVRNRVIPGFAAQGGWRDAISVFFDELATVLERLQGSAGERVAGSAVELASAALAEHARTGGRRPPYSPDFQRACEFIARNLPNPLLGAAAVAAGVFVSTRQLHKIFQAEGLTVSRWIRERRLEQCHRMLVEPGLQWMTVGDIGAAWGIFDRAHFSRIYRMRYGVSPREHRAEWGGLGARDR